MHCGNVSARGVRDQNRYTIGSAGGHSEPFDSGNKRVAFRVGDRFCNVGSHDFPHVGSMHLPLLEQAIAGELETPCKARSVLANRIGVVAQVEPEVERIEGRRADATVPRRKRMAEPMPIQKGGVQSTHIVVCSMSRSRDPPLSDASNARPFDTRRSVTTFRPLHSWGSREASRCAGLRRSRGGGGVGARVGVVGREQTAGPSTRPAPSNARCRLDIGLRLISFRPLRSLRKWRNWQTR